MNEGWMEGGMSSEIAIDLCNDMKVNPCCENESVPLHIPVPPHAPPVDDKGN